MIVENFLNKQLEELDANKAFSFPNIQAIKEIAKLDRLVILSSTLLCDGDPRVEEIYPTEDQTLNSKYRILLYAASLAQAEKAEKYKAIERKARQELLALREAEIDYCDEAGVVGRIDRTWYVLGDESMMLSQDFEFGIVAQTLSRKLEQSGMEVLYIGQRHPKRLLGLISVNHQISTLAPKLMGKMDDLGVEVNLLSSMKNSVLKAVVSSLVNSQTAILSSREMGAKYQKLGLVVTMSEKKVDGQLWVQNLSGLVEMVETAQGIMKRARKKFFWCKI